MDIDYYSNTRSDLLELVPLQSKKILDVGCASGNFGKSIKQRQNCHITGIELKKNIAQIAQSNLDLVLSGSIEKNIEKLQNEYDCIILADVIEHLKSPERILYNLSKKLSYNGIIIISVPNFSNYYVFEKLVYGNFNYDESGILDKTHLKFFSKINLIDLFNKLNLEITKFLYAKNIITINDNIISLFFENNINLELFLQECENFQYFITLRKSENIEHNKIFDNREDIIKRLDFLMSKNVQQIDILLYEILNLRVIDDIKLLYCLSYIYSFKREHKSALNILEKLSKLNLNKDLFYLFYFNLKNLGDNKSASIFYDKMNNISVYSPIKDILIKYPIE